MKLFIKMLIKRTIFIVALSVFTMTLSAKESNEQALEKVKKEITETFGTFPSFFDVFPKYALPGAWQSYKELQAIDSIDAKNSELNEDQKIKIALSAAPASVADGATVMEWESRKVLRQGSNGYFCFPTKPDGMPYPMCFDEQGIKWVEAVLSGVNPPPLSKVSIGYFLQGNNPMSNEDPYATPEEAANHVIAPGEPFIIMFFPDPGVLMGLPDRPEQGVPWVMWKNTPYIHLMIPAPSPVSK